MTAPAYQPVPTIAQRRALAADHARRYRDVQDSDIAEMQAARLRYVERAAGESCCGADEDAPPALFGLVAIWRDAFGLWWPLWIAGYVLFLAAGVVSFAALAWSYFA